MKKVRMPKALKPIGTWCKNHFSDICLASGLGAGLYSLISCAKETPHAENLYLERKKELDVDKLPVIETGKVILKAYPKTYISAGTSAALLIAGRRHDAKNNALLVSALTASETAFVSYREKVAEVITEKAEKELVKPILEEKKKAQEPLMAKNPEIFMPSMDDMIWYEDRVTGRRFWKTQAQVLSAVNQLNALAVNSLFAYYSDFLRLLDEPELSTPLDNLGWDVNDGAIEFRPMPGELDRKTGKTPTIIAFSREPKMLY